MLKDRIKKTIKILKEHEPPEGYYLGFSGGKDSIVLLDLLKKAKVKFDAHYLITSIEHPETLEFIKNFPEVETEPPKKTIEELIIKKGFPPIMNRRYCTTELKTKSGKDRLKVVGIRAAESPKRKNLEPMKLKGKNRYIFPIFEWLDKDIWEYIGKRNLKYHPLYDEGYKRIGCVLCPFASAETIKKEFEKYPEIVEKYRKACIDAYNARIARGGTYRDFQNGEDLFNWWKRILLKI